MFDRWSKAVFGQVEIDERAAHEDSSGMYFLIECVLAIDEENVDALPGEQARTLKSGQSGADDSYVVACSHERCREVLCYAKFEGKKRGGDGSAH